MFHGGQTAKVCVVTGANAGIGKATALGLAKMGNTVILACRNQKRGEQARSEITRKSRNDNVSLMLVDLSSQTSIRAFVDAYTSAYSTLDVLINNAAIIPQTRMLAPDGVEMQFAVNHLAPFLLTNLLLDRLRTTDAGRIITVSSMAHRKATILLDDLHAERHYQPRAVYAMTKLANVLFTYELARRLEGTTVTANCLHPGNVATNLLNDFKGRPRLLKFLLRIKNMSTKTGAQTSLYLATSQDVAGMSGHYFVRQKPIKSSELSYDKHIAKKLWKISAKLTGWLTQ